MFSEIECEFEWTKVQVDQTSKVMYKKVVARDAKKTFLGDLKNLPLYLGAWSRHQNKLKYSETSQAW